jgi:hypothetical protein
MRNHSDDDYMKPTNQGCRRYDTNNEEDQSQVIDREFFNSVSVCNNNVLQVYEDDAVGVSQKQRSNAIGSPPKCQHRTPAAKHEGQVRSTLKDRIHDMVLCCAVIPGSDEETQYTSTAKSTLPSDVHRGCVGRVSSDDSYSDAIDEERASAASFIYKDVQRWLTSQYLTSNNTSQLKSVIINPNAEQNISTLVQNEVQPQPDVPQTFEDLCNWSRKRRNQSRDETVDAIPTSTTFERTTAITDELSKEIE